MDTQNENVINYREISIEKKLRALYQLQTNDSDIDKIRILRGELPLEVRDLEDEIAGLQTRIRNFEDEVDTLKSSIVNKKNEKLTAESLIKKYENQQDNVRNNREYDSLKKEIEFQKLEIELCDKRITEYTQNISDKNALAKESKGILEEKNSDLQHKKSELEAIISDTKRDEEKLHKVSMEIEKIIEPRLLSAYKRIRANARNGLAVVQVERDACGGCFAKIPPQRELDISSRKKIIVCEYCGRILVDRNIGDVEE